MRRSTSQPGTACPS